MFLESPKKTLASSSGIATSLSNEKCLFLFKVEADNLMLLVDAHRLDVVLHLKKLLLAGMTGKNRKNFSPSRYFQKNPPTSSDT